MQPLEPIRFPFFLATLTTILVAYLAYAAYLLHCNRNLRATVAALRGQLPSRPEEWRSLRIDVIVYVLSKLIKRLPLSALEVLTITWVSAGVCALVKTLSPDHALIELSPTVLVLCSVVLFLFGDFANYVSHFLQHFIPVLWELHKVHHSACYLNPATTERMHPLGNLFDGLCAAAFVGIPAGLMQAVCGLSLAEVAILSANANLIGTLLVLDALRHSRIPMRFGLLDRLILSPHMHQLHHGCKEAHWDVNFGNKLCLWDRLFGTLVLPRAGEDIPMGLGKAEDRDYDHPIGIYLGPLVKIARLVRGQPVWTDPDHPAAPPQPFFARIFWRKPPEYRFRQARQAEPAPSAGACPPAS